MTPADRRAADALARHFAFEGGGFWDHLDPREQAVYRARALDVVQVIGPIYNAPSPDALPSDAPAIYDHAESLAWAIGYDDGARRKPLPSHFPRPMSKGNDR